MVGERAIGGEKPLGVPGGRAPLHAPLTLAGRLMRVVHTVVQVSVLPVLDAREHLPLRSPIACELIRDDDPRDGGQPCEERAEERLCRVRVAPLLYEDIEDVAVLIHGPPESVTFLLSATCGPASDTGVAGHGHRRGPPCGTTTARCRVRRASRTPPSALHHCDRSGSRGRTAIRRDRGARQGTGGACPGCASVRCAWHHHATPVRRSKGELVHKPRHGFRYIYGEVTGSHPTDRSHPPCPLPVRP